MKKRKEQIVIMGRNNSSKLKDLQQKENDVEDGGKCWKKTTVLEKISLI